MGVEWRVCYISNQRGRHHNLEDINTSKQILSAIRTLTPAVLLILYILLPRTARRHRVLNSFRCLLRNINGPVKTRFGSRMSPNGCGMNSALHRTIAERCCIVQEAGTCVVRVAAEFVLCDAVKCRCFKVVYRSPQSFFLATCAVSSSISC